MNETRNPTGGRNGEQLPLAFGHEAQSGREDLLISDPMSAAVTIVDQWPRWPSPVVVIVGPAGSGKSHLARIWAEKSGAVRIVPQAGGDGVEMASLGPVLFEDADRTAFDETTLFHVINAVRQNDTHLLMTARSWPLSWPIGLEDLKSRLKAATIVEIGEPDDALLGQVLLKLFADRQILVDDKLVDYIVARMERSLNAAMTIVERLDRLALARGKKIGRSLAAEVLNDFANSTPGD